MRNQTSACQPTFTTRTGFERKLAVYALASGAMLGIPVAAESATIYSGPMNITVNSSDPSPFYLLDVDGNGVDDFQFDASQQVEKSQVDVTGLNNTGPLFTNQVFTDLYGYTALNLSSSTTIPGGLKNYPSGKLSKTYSNPPIAVGQWSADGSPGYLGLMFDIDGATHYGWAQVRAYTNSGNPGEVWTSAFTLDEWAWESTPGASIHVGEIPEPSTLSLFALGAAGILAWRRRQKAVKQ